MSYYTAAKHAMEEFDYEEYPFAFMAIWKLACQSEDCDPWFIVNQFRKWGEKFHSIVPKLLKAGFPLNENHWMHMRRYATNKNV